MMKCNTSMKEAGSYPKPEDSDEDKPKKKEGEEEEEEETKMYQQYKSPMSMIR